MGSGDDLLSNDFSIGSMEYGPTTTDDLCYVFSLRVAAAIARRFNLAASHGGDVIAESPAAGTAGDRRHASAQPVGLHQYT